MNRILIGNVTGAEFPDRIYIAKAKGADILLGDILKVVDLENEEKEFLVRISGAVQPSSPDAERISKRLLVDPSFSTIASVRGSGDIYLGTLLCSFKPQNGFKKPYIPKELPTRHSNVYLPAKDDLLFIDNLEDNGYNLAVGSLRVRGEYQPIVKIKGEDLARHIGVYAITGKGKTGFTKVLLHKIAEEPEGRYGALVYDAHDEYYKTIQPSLVGMKEARLESVIYYDLHSPRVPKIALTSITPQDFRTIFGDAMTNAQIEHASILYGMFAEQWLLELIKLKLTELTKWRKERGLNPGTLAVLRRRAIILDRLGAFIQESARDFIDEVITSLDAGKVCIINTRNLAAIEEKAVLAVLTSKILNSRKRLLDEENGAELLSQKPILLIVLEEALGVLSQRVLRRGSNIFAELTREGRKYKVGLLTVVQIPHRLDQDVASNINTNVILGLAQDRSRRAVADNAMDDMAPLINEMKMLDIGEALISFPHKGEVPFPLPVKIFYYNEIVAERDKNVQKTRRVIHRGLRR